MIQLAKFSILKTYSGASTDSRFMAAKVIDKNGNESILVISAQYSWALEYDGQEIEKWLAKFQPDDYGWRLACWLVNHLNNESSAIGPGRQQ